MHSSQPASRLIRKTSVSLSASSRTVGCKREGRSSSDIASVEPLLVCGIWNPDGHRVNGESHIEDSAIRRREADIAIRGSFPFFYANRHPFHRHRRDDREAAAAGLRGR
jgi:hypothetical protein